jgi:hypothetical protein
MKIHVIDRTVQSLVEHRPPDRRSQDLLGKWLVRKARYFRRLRPPVRISLEVPGVNVTQEASQ